MSERYETCERCVYWTNESTVPPHTFCHRFPPSFQRADGYHAQWPITRPIDWCGEFSHRLREPISISSGLLLQRVDEMEISVRSANCLKNDDIIYIGDLILRTKNEMLRTPNFGKVSYRELEEILGARGLRFGMSVPGWPEMRSRHEASVMEALGGLLDMQG